jgi:hypothetical protein
MITYSCHVEPAAADVFAVSQSCTFQPFLVINIEFRLVLEILENLKSFLLQLAPGKSRGLALHLGRHLTAYFSLELL